MAQATGEVIEAVIEGAVMDAAAMASQCLLIPDRPRRLGNHLLRELRDLAWAFLLLLLRRTTVAAEAAGTTRDGGATMEDPRGLAIKALHPLTSTTGPMANTEAGGRHNCLDIFLSIFFAGGMERRAVACMQNEPV